MVLQSRIMIGSSHFELADEEPLEQCYAVGCKIRNTCMTSQLFFFTNLSCLPFPCSTPNSKAGNTGHRSQPDSPTGALTGLHLKMTAPFYVIIYIKLNYESQCRYTGNLCKMYIPVESDSSTKFT